MPRIALMPDELANQIAAGEVIERPASVVKELVENALDAGAHRIEVDIDDGGLASIKVQDDGIGMNPEDAEMCVLRHATSKLRDLDDLFKLSTMGFRGEALAAIASVSKCMLTTRTGASIAAYRMYLEGGHKAQTSREASGPIGTVIDVRELFYNVPARRKFMKTEATETGHISETILRLALSHPRVHFRLSTRGKTTLDLPAHEAFLERSRAAMHSRGRSAGPPSIYAHREVTDGIAVEVHAAPPSESTAVPRNVFLLINKRFVRDRSMLHAVTSGFGELLEKGRYPMAIVHITLDPMQIDINVHPQKLEVRLSQPDAVYAMVRQTIRELCVQAPWLKQHAPDGLPPRTLSQPYHLTDSRVRSPQDTPISASGAHAAMAAKRAQAPSAGGTAEHQLPLAAFAPTAGLAEHRERLRRAVELSAPHVGAPPDEAADSSLSASARSAVRPAGLPPAADAGLSLSDARFLGQLFQTYLLFEMNHHLILVDQHAAHERVVFERLLAAYRKSAVTSQRLLFPTTLHLDARRAALLVEHEVELGNLGFEVHTPEPHLHLLRSVPDLGQFGRSAGALREPEVLFSHVLDQLDELGRSSIVQERAHLLLATMACHAAIRAGDVLDEPRIIGLLAAMDEVHYSPYCPHGRPVLIKLTRTELERMFGRQ